MKTLDQLKDSIRSYAAQNSIKSTVLYANSYAKELFENYYLSVNDSKASMITDPELLQAFSDYRTGYRERMNAWLRDSGNPVKELKTPPDSLGHKTSKLLLFVGSVISVLIALFAHRLWWLSIITEVVVLTLFFYRYIKEIRCEEKKKNEFELQQILDYVRIWFDEGVKHSNRVLDQFGIV